ncbi:MAG: hypothetical protein MI723_19570, partial [Caulobacterales bacterium]|nr:hypothetical protein [Caulobacterales bacterium]
MHLLEKLWQLGHMSSKQTEARVNRLCRDRQATTKKVISGGGSVRSPASVAAASPTEGGADMFPHARAGPASRGGAQEQSQHVRRFARASSIPYPQ